MINDTSSTEVSTEAQAPVCPEIPYRVAGDYLTDREIPAYAMVMQRLLTPGRLNLEAESELGQIDAISSRLKSILQSLEANREVLGNYVAELNAYEAQIEAIRIEEERAWQAKQEAEAAAEEERIQALTPAQLLREALAESGLTAEAGEGSKLAKLLARI